MPKPTLAAVIIKQHLLAALLTLVATLLLFLIVADYLVLRSRGDVLANELRSVDVRDVPAEQNVAVKAIRGRAGRVAVIGVPRNPQQTRLARRQASDGQSTGGGRPYPYTLWRESHRILTAGEMVGVGRLPWTRTAVVWAARVVPNPTAGPDDPQRILIAWDPVRMVRLATRLTYMVVVGAILLAFTVSVLVSLHSARHVTRAIDQVAASASRMAGGDFAISLPPQPTVELDRVSEAVNQLARDLKSSIDDLRTEHARLTKLEGLQRQFVADAAHELRAPLTAMRVTLEAWQDEVLRPEERPEAIARLLRETQRLGTLVRNLLDLSRLEAGREVMPLTAVEVYTVSNEVVAGFAALPGAEISTHIPVGARVLADRDGLYRILYNLVENARRFTPPDGRIAITGAFAGDGLCISVTDTGCGIAAEELLRVWDRFARAEVARGEGKAGSGLGLSIVKALATAMGGEVGAQSVPGQGATFWVTLRTA